MATILVLDDDRGILTTLETVLRMAGHKVITATNGNRAADTLRAIQADLLIADLVMPDREGLETIQETRAQYPSLPIIAISGATFGPDGLLLDIAKKMGADAALAKPFTMMQLTQTVARLLGERN